MGKSIYEIKGLALHELKQTSPLDQWFYEMVQKSTDELTPKDISRMLRQEIYLDLAMPCAWGELMEDPFCGEMYEGQMLELLAKALADHPQEKNIKAFRKLENKIKESLEGHEWNCNREKEEFTEVFKNFSSLFRGTKGLIVE